MPGFTESYPALLDWASRHDLHGIWALAWPLEVDSFIAVGERALFVALADSWPVKPAGGSRDSDRARAGCQRGRQHRPCRRTRTAQPRQPCRLAPGTPPRP